MHKHKKSQSGFTLVELSIVLVIIGLIISSVLVGQDLVRSAELRATITQLEGFNAAVGTFRGKYNGLPGDVAGATNFGFTTGANGNGDGLLISVCAGTGSPCDAAASMSTTGENNFFWNHLGSSGAALISGSYLGTTALTSANISTILPSAKAGNYWGVYAGGSPSNSTATAAEGGALTTEAGTNYYILGVVGGTSAAMTTAGTLTPLEAQNIDSKIDDGKPSIGIIRARGTATADLPDQAPSSAVAGGTTTCAGWLATSYVTAPSTNTYQTKTTTAVCTLRFKMPL